MENSTTTISREELEELQEAFNKIGKLQEAYLALVFPFCLLPDFRDGAARALTSAPTQLSFFFKLGFHCILSER